MSTGFFRPSNRCRSSPFATAVWLSWPFLLILASVHAGHARGQSGQPDGRSSPPSPLKAEGKRIKDDKEAANRPDSSLITHPAPFGTPAPSIGNLNIPAGTVVIIADDPKKAERLVPRAVILTPQQYQKLLNQIDRLSQENRPARPENPSSCKVTGCIEEDVARLTILYEFATERADTFINLGCARAWATGAKFDGELPSLQVGDDGYVVKIKKPGNHQGTLDIVVPLGMRRGIKGPERGFDLDLPRPAINMIENLKWSGNVLDVKLAGRSVRVSPGNKGQLQLERVPIVPVDHLELRWRMLGLEPRQGPPVLTADSKIGVQISESQVVVEARVNLQVLRGQTRTWRMLVPVPEKAELSVKADPRAEGRIERIDRSGDSRYPALSIQLKEPSNDPIGLTLQIRLARANASVALGPFIVLDTLSQRGEIEIRAPDDVRLYYQPRSEVTRQEISSDQRRDMVRGVFSYWNLAAEVSPPFIPLLKIDIEPIKGVLEARTSHTIRLSEATEEGGGRLFITTRLEATPIRTRVDHLNVSLPAELRLDPDSGLRPAGLVEDFTRNTAKDNAVIKLAERQDRPFTLTLEGWYPLAVGQKKIDLELPRLSGWNAAGAGTDPEPSSGEGQRRLLLDRGCQITMLMPEGTDLLAEQFQKNLPSKFTNALGPLFSPLRIKGATREYALRSEKSLERLELAWTAHRPDVKVDETIDLSLAARWARVNQEFHLHLGQPPPDRIFLRVPAPAQSSFQVVAGGTVVEGTRHGASGRIPIDLTGPVNRDHKIIVNYSIRIAESNSEAQSPQGPSLNEAHAALKRISLPVVHVEEAAQNESKVRVWSDAGMAVGNANNSWEERPCEIVEGRSSLPILVISCRSEEPITLDISQTASAVVSAVVERALIQAAIEPSGLQVWRARYWLGQVAMHNLAIRFPVPLARSDVEARLGDKRVALSLPVEAGSTTPIGQRMLFEVEPNLYPSGVMLDVRFSARPDSSLGRGLLALQLDPPILENSLVVGTARWQLMLPADFMAIHLGGGAAAERRWDWWKWLPGPSAAMSERDLDRWISHSNTSEIDEGMNPRLVCRQTLLGSLSVVLISQRLWLFTCSLCSFVIILALLLAWRRPICFWVLAFVLSGSLGLLSAYWPGTLPVLAYGCEPAVLIVLALGILYLLLQLRHRRQLAELPGFSRVSRTSSLAKTEGVNGQRPPSTVDSPPKRASSVASKLGSG
jgi:hypothetical protein